MLYETEPEGYSIVTCACIDGAYIGARKTGTPECCERCGFMTDDQLQALLNPRRGDHEVDVKIVEDPAGRPAVLLQLPSGYITIHKPEDVRVLAGSLIEASDDLEEIVRGAI